MDWDKIRIFHAAAEAGSFTRAGETLSMSQSAVSRQIAALEDDLNVALFHRHARGLVLTEQGEMLYRTANEVCDRIRAAETRLADSKDKPYGDLRVTTTVGLGGTWLAPRLGEFIELYPDIHIQLLLQDEELDLILRQADAAIWLKQPTHNDLIQRRLFTVHFHVYASGAYLRRFGSPKSPEDLDKHRLLSFASSGKGAIPDINWLETAGRGSEEPRQPALCINSLYALRQATQRGMGLAVLPDYLVNEDTGLVPVLSDAEMPKLNTYFVYPMELRTSKRVNVFRDFLVSKAREWPH